MFNHCGVRLLAKDSESAKPLLAAAVAADPIADWREYGESSICLCCIIQIPL